MGPRLDVEDEIEGAARRETWATSRVAANKPRSTAKVANRGNVFSKPKPANTTCNVPKAPLIYDDGLSTIHS